MICWWLFLINLEESAAVGTIKKGRQPRRTGILVKLAGQLADSIVSGK
jgi:hypothetical protein